MRRSVVVDVSTRMVLASAVVLSLYLLAAGHNQPGGGFIGGLVGGAAVSLVYVAGGLDQVRRLVPLRPWTVLGTGLVIASLSATVPLLFGGAALEQDFATVTVPIVGDVKVTSALVFDSGVYGVVVGLMLMAFEALGEESPPEEAQ